MKRLSNGALAYGFESYWTLRLADKQSSWAGVAMVARMGLAKSVTKMAARHLKLLDRHPSGQQRYVLDAGHGQGILASYSACQHTELVMRVKGHQCFYFEPDNYQGRVALSNMVPSSNARTKASQRRLSKPSSPIRVTACASAVGHSRTSNATARSRDRCLSSSFLVRRASPFLRGLSGFSQLTLS